MPFFKIIKRLMQFQNKKSTGTLTSVGKLLINLFLVFRCILYRPNSINTNQEKKMKKVLFGILAMMTVLSVQARPGFFLGSVSLTDRKDVDVIHLRSCRTRSNRPVSQIKLKVKKVPAEIDRLKDR